MEPRDTLNARTLSHSLSLRVSVSCLSRSGAGTSFCSAFSCGRVPKYATASPLHTTFFSCRFDHQLSSHFDSALFKPSLLFSTFLPLFWFLFHFLMYPLLPHIFPFFLTKKERKNEDERAKMFRFFFARFYHLF